MEGWTNGWLAGWHDDAIKEAIVIGFVIIIMSLLLSLLCWMLFWVWTKIKDFTKYQVRGTRYKQCPKIIIQHHVYMFCATLLRWSHWKSILLRVHRVISARYSHTSYTLYIVQLILEYSRTLEYYFSHLAFITLRSIVGIQ